MTSFKTKKIIRTENKLFKESLITESFSKNNENLLNWETTTSRKKKRHPLQKLIGAMLIIASLVFFGILWLQAAGNIGLSNKLEEIKVFNPIISLIDNTTNQEVVQNTKGIKNILIAGIGWKGHPGGELTDSLMLASLDYDKKTATLLSIPRDLYVAYSSNTAGKINALYPMGQTDWQWVNYLAKKVSEITGQPIHHYAIIDFSGFKSIVNALGGVEINVPADIYDREYPNNNWWYEVFSLKKWLQTLDGETALKFARSRHSTSDFDRSMRQQLLLQAIKDKALSLGILTNPQKITSLVESVRNNLSTDLTIGDLVDIGLNFKDMNNSDIITYSYSDSCSSTNCLPGSYLYVPVRENFGGAWVLLPDGATKSRLSRYESMRTFANLIFQFPHLKDEETAIHIITNNKNLSKARLIRQNLQQLGFPVNYSEIIIQTGATLGNSRIHSYYDKSTGSGFSDESTLIKALKQVEESIPYSSSPENIYSINPTPSIEIILGDDAKNFFKFNISTISSTSSTNNINTTSTRNSSTTTVNQKNTTTSTNTTNTNTNTIPELPSEQQESIILPSEQVNSSTP